MTKELDRPLEHHKTYEMRQKGWISTDSILNGLCKYLISLFFQGLNQAVLYDALTEPLCSSRKVHTYVLPRYPHEHAPSMIKMYSSIDSKSQIPKIHSILVANASTTRPLTILPETWDPSSHVGLLGSVHIFPYPNLCPASRQT